MKNQTFKECQCFNDKLVFLFLAAGIAGAFTCITKSFFQEQLTLANALIYGVIATGLGFLLWWLRQLKLKVSVNGKRIKYKMTPIHRKAKKITWEEVESCQVIKTPFAAQWHGGNMRFSRELWYSFSGRNGLSIKTKDGRQLFIGCRNIDELLQTLNKFNLSPQ